jgi:hypothetical protein
MRLQRAAAIAVLSALTLGSATGRSDDASKAPPPPPAAGFLEFLGSVDRLSELNPNYLSQPGQRKERPTANGGTRPPPAPPPPPPGDKNNG